ncbi:FtsB family cell division protein [Bifidobacterium xylocopae]|uniref:Septum formation initiator n=1 Tax=Bifidobacterium xylocopae TaxID=2493119 RepID=A0A366KE90_9BIFI|nr:septum formation initiator family protein [Bifidobacterium xylocopae]RBQ00015.1 septum formation initiator [Bifidobacterium xylocopae]
MTRASLPGAKRATVPSNGANPKRRKQGAVSLCVCLIIVFIGAVQLVSTFHTYALSLSELNGLKNQQAALVEQKSQLENDIARWNDQAYVTAQARDRLGFVFPGEQAIRVLNPESVTGGRAPSARRTKPVERTQARAPLPWYRELAYSLGKADTPTTPQAKGRSGMGSGDGGHVQGRTDSNGQGSGL